jgi:hypothetical protein
MDPDNNPTTDLLNMLSKAMDGKVYGSIEVYLEEGQITQISQRIIKKIKRTQTHQIKIKKSSSLVKSSRDNLTVKFQN